MAVGSKVCRAAAAGLALALVASGPVFPGVVAEVRAQPAAAEAPAPAPRFGEAAEAARTLLDSLVAAAGLPGLSVAVGADGRVVWSRGFGLADMEGPVSVTPLTKFRIGSVSKSLTSVALGRLVEEGRLDLDAPVRRYLPSFPEKRWPLTTRQLAGHLAGIRHYRGDEFLSARRYAGVREGVAIFRDDSLLFEPGTAFHYSSYGWNLLAAVVEAVSGEEFLSYVRRWVLEPAGLRHTVADHPDSLISHRSRFYRRAEGGGEGGEGGGLLNAPYVDNSYKWAGGGYLSTPEDLVRFGLALLAGGLLEPGTVELLFTSQRTADGRETGYGLGWYVDRDGAGRRVVYHGGGSVGGTTILLAYPEEGVVVAVTTNLTDAPVTRDLAQHVAGPFLRVADPAPAPDRAGATGRRGMSGR